jgi:flagellar biosynthesis component FlhA
MRVFAYALATAACIGLAAPMGHVAVAPVNDVFAGSADQFSAQAKSKKKTTKKSQNQKQNQNQNQSSQKETTGRSSWGG